MQLHEAFLSAYTFEASSSSITNLFHLQVQSSVPSSDRPLGTKIVSAAFEETENLLIVVWSDGLWEGFKLHRMDSVTAGWRLDIQFARRLRNLIFKPPSAGSEPEESSKEKEIKEPKKRKSSKMETTVISKSIVEDSRPVPFSMCFIDSSHVCMFGLRPMTSSESKGTTPAKSLQPVFLLWELRYFTIQAENEAMSLDSFPAGLKPEMAALPRSPFDYVALVALGNCVHAFNVQVIPPTVGSTLKAMESTIKYVSKNSGGLTPGMGTVTTLAVAPLDKHPSKWLDEISALQARDRELLQGLESAVVGKSATKISQSVEEILKSLAGEAVKQSSSTTSTTQSWDKAPRLSAHIVIRMVDLCLSCGEGIDALCFLLESGCISLASHPNLRADALLNRKDLRLMENVLRYARDIPESDLSKILQWILEPSNASILEAYLSAKESSAKESSMEVDEKQEEAREEEEKLLQTRIGDDQGIDYFLALIASVPADQAFLTHHLQYLTFSQAMAMLLFSSKWMKRHAQLSELWMKKWTDAPIPSFSQIVTLATSLVDAHFASFALSGEALPVVEDLSREVSDHVVAQESLADLEACLWWANVASQYHGNPADGENTAEKDDEEGGAYFAQMIYF